MAVSNATLLAKLSALEARMNTVAPIVKSNESGVTPLLVISNASFLSTLNAQHPASKITAFGDPAIGAPGTSYSQSYANAQQNRINDLISYVESMASSLNDLYDALQSTNIIT